MSALVQPLQRSHGLAEAVLNAQRLLRDAASPTGLREAAAAISVATEQTGCSALVPASSSARGAVAAAVLLSDGALTEASDGDVLAGRADKVLVVEVVAISGLNARQRVRSLREAGAAWIGLFVLCDLAPASDRSERERFGPVDHLVLGD